MQMAVQEHEIQLKNFSFPEKLPNNRANFRFVIDLRYQDEKGKFATETAVLPGLDTWWECDLSKEGKPNYVREGEEPRFDMDKVDDWDKLVLRLKATRLFRMQVKVFDVDRPDFWDKVTDALSNIIGAVLGKAKSAVEGLPIVGEGLGSLAEDAKSTVAKLLAGGDKVLFKGSEVPAETFTVAGMGSANKKNAGEYEIEFSLSSEAA
jgi:hypothetical protein